MSVFIDKNTKVMVTRYYRVYCPFHTKQMLDYGTKIVAGVTPGKGGQVVEGVPVFNTVEEAKNETGGNGFSHLRSSTICCRLNFRSS